MKKVILLSVTFAIFSFVAVKSQNIVVNGDMESWTGGAPDGWTKAENISQEAIIIHGGNYSAKHTSDQTTKDLQQDISGIQGGQDYTINYWYLDNDPEARTRIWSYWLSGVSTLPDHVEILRPSTYSEDNPNWQEFNVVLTAPASADGFRFEVRVYKQDDISGGSVYYDDFVFSGDIIVDPEPSNYPTNFTATASNLSIDLSWTDATGTQLPSAYIIMAGIDPSLPVPIDGTPVPDDTDLSDGNGALNISYGVEEATFANLEGNTTYYFTIYPYTNSGSNIDFKTDGTAPAANAITSDLTIIEFENFDVSWGNWTTISVVGEQVWDRDNNYGLNNTPCARMNGYAGGPVENDDWLISPAMDFDNYDNETLVFYNAKNYDGPDMECKISTDYNGGGDPYSATWTTLSYIMTPGSWEWTFSGEIDISGFNGSAVYVAFQYTSTSSEAATWEVDDISITGEEDIIILPEPSNYPTNFAADASGTTINLSWTDAVGTQLPDKYIIFAGIDSSLPVPVDGTPVPDDPDLSDGSGALNVAYGLEEGSFDNLDPNTTYYFSIYPYTNSGSYIDFKNDGVAPTANATITLIPEPSNYPTNFNADATVTTINLSWTDAIGTQLPDAYIIFAGIDSSLPVPVDGTPVPDDPDLSDGSGALNVAYGLEEGSFDNLDPNTTYYFSIYPYTNSGSYIDFKNDGVAPTANATITLIPEPSNYPTNFNADVTVTTINLSWTDAIGTQLPDAYIIFAGINSSLPVPADGTPVPDDPDLSDGSGALNVNYGIEEGSFGNLDPNTTYYFSIYSYTNSGVNIDFKNDGVAPTANATIGTVTTVTIEYENFDESWGNWTTISVVGSQVWDRNNTYGINYTPCAKMSGYEGQAYENDDWLISPAMNFTDYMNEQIVFYTAMSYTGNDLEFKASTDYDGGGDPYSATWTTLSYTMSSGGFEWTESGEIDLSGFEGSAVYVAFQFTSTNSASATWEVDEILITGDEETTIDPEPTNYPTDFAADASGTTINLTWTDAVGTQLPDKYIIFAGINSSLPVPADGTPVPDDPDLSDGSGALNVNYGIEEGSFGNLDPNTTYYFSIYSYTNSGVNIDFKNDGVAPTANATIGTVTTVTIEYENFDESWGNWTTISVVGSQVWDRNNTYGINYTPCAKMSGYEGQAYENDDWLISPAMNFTDYMNEQIVFYTAMSYTGNDLEFKASTDYDGGGDPYSATWTTLSYTMSSGGFEWTESGEIDLSGFEGSAVYVAFQFTSTNSASATWEVDEILITGDEETTIDPEPTNYPTDFAADASGTTINLTWTDAVGTQLPDKYIIFAGINSSLPVPVDGAPVQNDSDLSDGEAVVNVPYGVETYSFAQGLTVNTTYYFSIYSYTNSGTDINYKNDGTAPTANATTIQVTTVTIEEENFDNSWGNWTTISVTGSQVWDRDNTYGINYTPCAKMSGYEGQAYENDDWLISPPMNFENYFNERIVFWNAKDYTGPDLEFKISTDYDGGADPYSANWNTLAFNMSPGSFDWVESGVISLSDYEGSSVYVAFRFTSTNSTSATWEIDDIIIEGEEEMGIHDPLDLSQLIRIYPNPSTGLLNIENSGETFNQAKILSITGKLVNEFELQGLNTKLDLSHLENGIYFVTFINTKSGQTITRKLILR